MATKPMPPTSKGKEKERAFIERAIEKGIVMGTKAESRKKKESSSKEKLSPDVLRIKSKQKIRQNVYLQSLLDPVGFGPAKIPDLTSYPSTTFSLRQVVPVASNTSGQFSIIVNPWHNSMYLTNTTGNPYNWQASSGNNAAQATVIEETFSSLRVVSGIVTARFVGNINDTQGLLTACLINPHEVLPDSYVNFTQYAMSRELPLVDGISVLWKPCDRMCDEYVDSNWEFLNSSVYSAWDQPATPGSSPPAAVLHYTNGSSGLASNSWNAWGFQDANGTQFISSYLNTRPSILIAGNGMAISVGGIVEVEINWNFEALLAQNTYAPGSSPAYSPIDPVQYTQARQVVSQIPTVVPVKEASKKGFWDYAAPIIEKVADKALPFLATLL